MNAVVQETSLALVPPAKRVEITQQLYSAREEYKPGGEFFEGGLFPWEEEAIRTPPFPPAGRVLIGGAGGGREVRALVAQGYEVVAFDPSDGLVRSAYHSPETRALELHCASYDDLVTAAVEGTGVLAPVLRDRHFDAVIFGWASLNYVHGEERRLSLLRAVRRLAPQAIVLLSYTINNQTPGRRETLRRVLHRLGGQPVSPLERFHPTLGFYSVLAEGEDERLAASAGYAIAWKRKRPYAHAVLVPAGDR